MLSGVSFRKDEDGAIKPEFVNQYILTDVYLSTISSPHLRSPILPSIATLVNPLSSLVAITLRIIRTILLVIFSRLPGSRRAIKKISVANTAILYHDGRALATCESGPPMRIALPGLESVGWFDGSRAEGEPVGHSVEDEPRLGGDGLLSFMREWTTAHPKVDPYTNEMMLFHSSFAPPYVQYSIIPENNPAPHVKEKSSIIPSGSEKLLNKAVPGVTSAKMMHDFGVSLSHTVIMDLPLSLDPLNLVKNQPVVSYDSSKPSRFGVFPRRRPDQVKWFSTNACCIFHTANTWDETDASGNVQAVNMLACRLTSSNLVFSAGNIAAPQPTKQTIRAVRKKMPFFEKYDVDFEDCETLPSGNEAFAKACQYDRAPDLESPRIEREPLLRMNSLDDQRRAVAPSEVAPMSILAANDTTKEPDDDVEEDQCRLYHYRFSLSSGQITAQYGLCAIPFEFPTVRPDLEMQHARYIYGCSTTTTSFGAALGRAVKIDALVKVDSTNLIALGERLSSLGILTSVTGCVDQRSMQAILQSQDPFDPVKVFRMPEGWYAQEPRFVPRANSTSEDDGYLLTYAFDESQLGPDGEVVSEDGVRSELWIINARDMKTVVGRVQLPQRVPYGLHGTWFSEEAIQGQRAVEKVRTTATVMGSSDQCGFWMGIRNALEVMLA